MKMEKVSFLSDRLDKRGRGGVSIEEEEYDDRKL